MDKQIKIVTGDMGFGFRVLCNLSPEELKERKEVDFKLDGFGTEPQPSKDLSGYWSYFVKLH